MREISRLTALCFVLALAFGCTGCSSDYDSPTELGQAWSAAMSNFDKEAMANCHVEADRQEMKDQLAKMEESMNSTEASDRTTTFESAKEVNVGGKAYQVVTVSFPAKVSVNGKSTSKRITMEKVAVQQDGDWRFSLSEEAAYRKAKRAGS